MVRSAHPVAEEELMAYLDGELPVARARECAAHLAQCPECQALASDLKAVYQQMGAWQIGATPETLNQSVMQALESLQNLPRSRQTSSLSRLWWMVHRPWVWAIAGAAILLLVIRLPILNFHRTGESVRSAVKQPAPVVMNPYSAESATKSYIATSLEQLKEQADTSSRNYEQAERRYQEQNLASSLENSSTAAQTGPAAADELQQTQNAIQTTMPPAPMIARTASVNLVARDFDKARSELDAILRRHNGYAADLKLDAPPDQARTLTASLRVPADQLDVTLRELKNLGRVEQESQGGEEVTQQYVDVNARLSNDRNTEQRLLQILNQRAGKLSDVLAVEQEVARVRGEIEQMEAESKSLEHRVAYTSLDVQLKEEYKAALQVAPPSTFGQMRNSLVEGVEGALDSLIGLARFLLYAGPTLLLWALILFFPVRFVWRRWRAAVEAGKGSA